MTHYAEMEIPNSSGETKRQVLMHVVESTNGEVVPDELSIDIKCPYELRHVVDIYFKLSNSRRDALTLDPTTIHNYLSMRNQTLSAFEHDALAALDTAFISAMHKRD